MSDVLEVNAGRARQNLPPLPHEEMFGRQAVASIGPSNNLVNRGIYAKMIMKWLHYFPLRYLFPYLDLLSNFGFVKLQAQPKTRQGSGLCIALYLSLM